MLLLLWRKTSLRNFFFLFNLLKKLLVRRSRLEKIAASWLLALYLDLFKPKENKSQHWTFFYCCELHALVTAAWITNTVRVHSRSFHYFQFDIFYAHSVTTWFCCCCSSLSCYADCTTTMEVHTTIASSLTVSLWWGERVSQIDPVGVIRRGPPPKLPPILLENGCFSSSLKIMIGQCKISRDRERSNKSIIDRMQFFKLHWLPKESWSASVEFQTIFCKNYVKTIISIEL